MAIPVLQNLSPFTAVVLLSIGTTVYILGMQLRTWRLMSLLTTLKNKTMTTTLKMMEPLQSNLGQCITQGLTRLKD
jgi:hypothetical protein